jgi:rhodanese-related sulfurtransferase
MALGGIKVKKYILLMAAVFGCVVAKAADEFPFRTKYEKLKFISTDELKKIFSDVVIVDVRSKFEFEVIAIKNAINIPMSNLNFLPSLGDVRSKTGLPPIAFYCNGKTCEKSYEAGDAAMKAGFENILIYDAGVNDWVVANPQLASLFGKTPVDKTKLIAASAYAAKNVSYEKLVEALKDNNAIAVDVREPKQRKFIPKIADLRNIPIDTLVGILEKDRFKDKSVYFLDSVGKQNQWLNYYLERYGYKNYFFLKDGIDGIPH